MSGLRIEGLERLSRKLKELPKEATDVVLAELSAGAQDIRAAADAKAAIDTGRMKGGITVEPIKGDRKGFVISASIFYSGFVEFGTGRLVNRALVAKYPYYAAQVRALAKGRRNRNGRSQPFFFPAWEQNEKRIFDSARKALSNYIRSKL